MMLRRIALAAAICAGFAAPAAADYESGLTAFRASEFATAVVQLQASAETGDAASQNLLGQINENGLGVPQNFLRAHAWYNLAAGQGHEPAAQAREALTKRMAAEEVAKAQALASEWLPVGMAEGDGPVAFSVTNAQRLLVQLGYDPGSVDGLFKAQTRNAIRKFQGKAKLEANGRLTPDLFAALAESAGVKIKPAKTTVGEPATQPQEPVAREDEAARHVADIQARLRQMGYDVPSVSGQVDEKTRAAIRTYEADQGMTVTGTASQAVLDHLNAQARDKAAEERELVRRVQVRLNALGYDAGPADGAMGGRTETAIEMFQRKRGLLVTGAASAELVANLDAALTEQKAAETAKAEGAEAQPAPDTELVLAIETELNTRGYDAGVEDGVLTEETTRAVVAYQKDAGIEADGQVTEALLARIQTDDSNAAAAGLSPAQVTDLERGLEDRGYRIGAVDGRVDGDLRAAIRMYQADVGLDVTGEPSAELLAQIEASPVGGQKSPTTTGALIEGLTGKVLERLDKGEQSE